MEDKVWIYQSSREFTAAEELQILADGKNFVVQWSSHGAQMKAEISVRYKRFIVLIADERQAMASGCSIDKSVHFIREMESKFGINLLDRSMIAYETQTGTDLIHFSKLQSHFDQGTLTTDTIIFNNTVSDFNSFEKEWRIPFKNSPLFAQIKPVQKSSV